MDSERSSNRIISTASVRTMLSSRPRCGRARAMIIKMRASVYRMGNSGCAFCAQLRVGFQKVECG